MKKAEAGDICKNCKIRYICTFAEKAQAFEERAAKIEELTECTPFHAQIVCSEKIAGEPGTDYRWRTVSSTDDLPGYVLNPSLEELNMMIQTLDVLHRAGIEDTDQLLQLSVSDIWAMAGAGARTVRDIRTKLSEYGLYLRGDEEWQE